MKTILVTYEYEVKLEIVKVADNSGHRLRTRRRFCLGKE
jgi:hypothetical protein